MKHSKNADDSPRTALYVHTSVRVPAVAVVVIIFTISPDNVGHSS